MTLPNPKAPSALIKVSRWSMLALGVSYGFTRNRHLAKKEMEFKAKEELERPAKEAALKAEKEKKYREEMEYLGRETGVTGSAAAPGKSDYKSDCGCKY